MHLRHMTNCKCHARRHSLSFPLASPLAMLAPSGLNAQQYTSVSCPSDVAVHAPVAASHSFRCLSALQDSKRLPWIGLNAHRRTEPVWPINVRRHTPVEVSHSFNVLSPLQLKMVLPSVGLKRHATTPPVWPLNVRMHAPVVTDQSLSVTS